MDIVVTGDVALVQDEATGLVFDATFDPSKVIRNVDDRARADR